MVLRAGGLEITSRRAGVSRRRPPTARSVTAHHAPLPPSPPPLPLSSSAPTPSLPSPPPTQRSSRRRPKPMSILRVRSPGLAEDGRGLLRARPVDARESLLRCGLELGKTRGSQRVGGTGRGTPRRSRPVAHLVAGEGRRRHGRVPAQFVKALALGDRLTLPRVRLVGRTPEARAAFWRRVDLRRAPLAQRRARCRTRGDETGIFATAALALSAFSEAAWLFRMRARFSLSGWTTEKPDCCVVRSASVSGAFFSGASFGRRVFGFPSPLFASVRFDARSGMPPPSRSPKAALHYCP